MAVDPFDDLTLSPISGLGFSGGLPSVASWSSRSVGSSSRGAEDELASRIMGVGSSDRDVLEDRKMETPEFELATPLSCPCNFGGFWLFSGAGAISVDFCSVLSLFFEMLVIVDGTTTGGGGSVPLISIKSPAILLLFIYVSIDRFFSRFSEMDEEELAESDP